MVCVHDSLDRQSVDGAVVCMNRNRAETFIYTIRNDERRRGRDDLPALRGGNGPQRQKLLALPLRLPGTYSRPSCRHLLD
jgi:methylmalonyl-CoA mutase cobalamin-binding subunit